MKAPAVDIAAYLSDSNHGYELGANMFISRQPNSPSKCITLYDSSSAPPMDTLDGVETYFEETVQIIVRDIAYESAYATCRALISALHGIRNLQTEESRYLRISLVSGPIQLSFAGTGAEGFGDKIQFSINFGILRTPQSQQS